MEARRNGAKLYTIDPHRNRTGAAADKHFFINPGSDTALALAMMHVIIGENLHDADYVERYTEGFDALRERVRAWTPQRAAELTGIAAEEIVQLAREYATTRPAVIRLNYGVQRSERGATAVRTIALLPALTGSWKDVGGGLQLSTSQAFQLNRAGLERADLQQKSLGREARIVNMSQLGQALTTLSRSAGEGDGGLQFQPGRHRARTRTRCSRGLRREDLFTVVLEQFQTDTADYADILLPVTTFLEHTDLYLAYGHYHLQLARPALPPPGETKINVEIFRLLAPRMGFDDALLRRFRRRHDPHAARFAAPVPQGHHAGAPRPRALRPPATLRKTARRSCPSPRADFGTPDGKCHFDAEALDYQPPVESRHGDADHCDASTRWS